MTPIDELVIAITGDTTGLSKAVSQAVNIGKGGVEALNNEEVDWTSIFTRAVSPAIIAGVASMFALAISQLINFNTAASNLNNVATPATNSLSNSVGMASDQLYNLAESSGSSLGDTTAGFEAFSKAGLDSAGAIQATTDAAGIARDTGESMSSVVSELVDLFQQWGVTSAPQVTDALTGLVNAAQNGKFSFDQLVTSIAAQGQILQGKTNISDVAVQLAALSNQSGLTQTSILDSFNAIATGVANPLSQIDILVGNVGKAVSSGPDGLITAFQMIQSKVGSMGPAVAQTVLNTIGVSTGTLSNFGDTTTASFKNSAAAADYLRTHLIDLNTDLQNHESLVGKVSVAWNDFATWLTSTFAPIIQGVITDFNDFGNALKTLDTKPVQTILSDLGTAFSDVGKYLGQTNQFLLQGGLGSYLQGLGSTNSINEKLQSAGILDYNTLQNIDTAGGTSQSALVTALTTAIQKAGGNTQTNLVNTFKLTMPSGSSLSANAVANSLAKQLYSQFQGTNP